MEPEKEPSGPMPLHPRVIGAPSDSGHSVRNHVEMHGGAVAAAVADVREEISVHVHAVPGDSREESFAVYGLPGSQDDV